MGQHFSAEPVVEKETERDHNDTFNVAVSSCQGWRMSQEDNHSLMLELPGEQKAAFFAVYDGHGSAKVSKHASEGLWRHLVENEMFLKGNYKEALERSFLTFDREVNESYNAQLAGTTAVCLLIVNNTIYCANIGDSRGVACVNCECVPLSYDHKPENPQELKRILAAGGYVLGNRVNGNLALSRAFGDFHYKNNEDLPPEQQIVSPCPDVKTLELNDDVDFLVLACDGIWDVLSSEEVVEFVISRLEQSMEPGLICEQLTTRCLATDYELVIGCDNMTVLLICYTRGRSWVDFCTDIFNKNTRKLGVPRIRPTSDQENFDTFGRAGTCLSDPTKPEDVRTEEANTEFQNDADVFRREEGEPTFEETLAVDAGGGGGGSDGSETNTEESRRQPEDEGLSTPVEYPRLPAESCTLSESTPTTSQDEVELQENQADDDKEKICSLSEDVQQNDTTPTETTEEEPGNDADLHHECDDETTQQQQAESQDSENKQEKLSEDGTNEAVCKLSSPDDATTGGAEKDCSANSEQEDSTSTCGQVEVES